MRQYLTVPQVVWEYVSDCLYFGTDTSAVIIVRYWPNSG